MKSVTAIIVPLLIAAPLASAFVAEMFSGHNCEGDSLGERDVWDNTCAYVNPGFSSFRLKTHSWNDFTQIGTVYSPQRCSGDIVWQGCVGDSVNQVPIGGCYDLSDTGNALSSFSSGGPCPK